MVRLLPSQIADMEENAYHIRDLAIRMICIGKWGHLGGSLSLAEILAVLYGGFATLDTKNPKDPLRDYIILSKAHSSPALYAALAVKGILTREELDGYCSIQGLEGHLDQIHTPGIEASGGSLGIGLSYSVGVALALKKQERFSQRVYCILGDGELSEGGIWEAAMSASQYRLDNLTAIVDYNKVMAKGFVYNEMTVEPLAERFRSFGWTVLEADGHDVGELYQALHQSKYICVTGRPVCLIAHTVKGRGIAQCEFNYKWHTHAPGVEKANEFLAELAQRWGRPYRPIDKPVRKTLSLQDVVEGE